VTAFEVVETQFLFQLAVVHLDPPTRRRHLRQEEPASIAAADSAGVVPGERRVAQGRR
jgi:hypothetical protein